MAVFKAGHIKQITAVSEPFPTGQYITTAVVEYDQPVAASSVRKDTFSVKNRTVLNAYANSTPKKSSAPSDGPFVILELDITDADAPLLQTEDEYGRTARNSSDKKEEGRPAFSNYTTVSECRVEVLQQNSIHTVEGLVLPGLSEPVASRTGENAVIDKFQYFSFEDFNTAVFLPDGYTPMEKYPLVLFLSDASVLGTDPLLPLIQGNGAVSFAQPDFQQRHPCIVLAPAIPEKYRYRSIDGLGTAKRLTEPLMRLLDKAASLYSIDKNRIYTTGQSLGCFTSCALNILHPDYFAASLLVAGQWDAGEMAPLAQKNLWMVVSDGDRIAYPSMNAIADEFEKDGAVVNRYLWNAREDISVLQTQASRAACDAGNIKYSVWVDSSVVTDEYEVNPLSNHFCTWPITYTLDALKEWLFSKSK